MRVEIQLHVILTSALVRGELSASRLDRFAQEENSIVLIGWAQLAPDPVLLGIEPKFSCFMYRLFFKYCNSI
jgi:hypothetical protein